MSQQVNKLAVFCSTLKKVPESTEPFSQIMARLDESAKRVYGEVSRESLSNCHGDWYEWLLAIAAWNVFREDKTEYLAFTIPNVSSFDSASLYEQDLANMVRHLRTEVNRTASVKLITSNPDFVIASGSLAKNRVLPTKITSITEATIASLETLYESFTGQCSFTDIRGYASVKLSLRPDRRLQIPHEGSLMKALYVHLQTRQWIVNPPGLKYYAISSKVSDADRKALRTVATHSITTVGSKPQSAVDDIFAATCMNDASEIFRQILSGDQTASG